MRKFSNDALKWEDIPYIDKVRLDPDFEPTDQEMMSSFGPKWQGRLQSTQIFLSKRSIGLHCMINYQLCE